MRILRLESAEPFGHERIRWGASPADKLHAKASPWRMPARILLGRQIGASLRIVSSLSAQSPMVGRQDSCPDLSGNSEDDVQDCEGVIALFRSSDFLDTRI